MKVMSLVSIPLKSQMRSPTNSENPTTGIVEQRQNQSVPMTVPMLDPGSGTE